jgi:ketosteroid isomerase-like protein
MVTLALGSLLLAPTVAMGQDTPQSVRQIEAFVAQYDSAWNRQDTVTVGRLMAPEYQYFTSLGAVRSRVPMLAFLGSREYVLQAAERSEVVVTLSGPVAVVSSRWKGHGTYQGKRFVDDQRCGLVWRESGQRWQLVSEHCIQIAPDPWAPAE